MTENCYFCRDFTNNPETVVLYDGRKVKSCVLCSHWADDSKERQAYASSDNNTRVMGGGNFLWDN